MTKFAALTAKIYSNLTDDKNENKKANDIKTCVIKRKVKFEDYNNFLKANQLENEINHLKNNIQADGPKKIIKTSSKTIY